MSPLKFPKSEKYNFNKNLVKRHKLVGHLDRYLGTEVEEFEFVYEPKKGDDAWHPSGHCTPPPSELYEYARSHMDGTLEQKEWGTAMLKTFLVGHFWHQLLQKAVVELGLAKPEAIERRGTKMWGIKGTDSQLNTAIGANSHYDAKPFHWATGAGDVAPCTLPGHGDYIVDFKTMSGHQFKSASVPEWAADKYEAQINIYLEFFNLDKGLIVAIQKDSPHDMKEFEYVRNQPLIDAIFDKWEFVSECLDSNESPTELDDDCFSLDGLFKGPVAQ